MAKSQPKRVLTANKKIDVDSKLIRFAATQKPTQSLKTYNNPHYTDQELEYFEEAWSTTPAGLALDKRIEFVIGGGIKPTFELIDITDADGEELNDEEKERLLAPYQKYLDDLIKIDTNLNFNQKMYDAVVQAKTFGRSFTAFETLHDDKSQGIPKALKLIHTRNLNRVEFDDDTWAIKEIYSSIPNYVFKPEDGIYLVNKPDSPIRNSIWYGYSEFHRVVGAARAYRRIVEFDMPEIATSLWAPAFLILLKKLGTNATGSESEANNILNNIQAGAMSAVQVDTMDEIDLKTLDLKSNIQDLVTVVDNYERIMIGNSQTPSALLGREEDQNRATLIGKIRFFIEGPVKSDREWLSNQISKQWYERNLIKLGGEEILAFVKIKTEFEPIFMESWDDMVEAVEKLKRVMPSIPTEVILQILNLEEFKTKITAAEEEYKKEQDQLQKENKFNVPFKPFKKEEMR